LSARNLILSGLPQAQLALLAPHLVFVELPQGFVLVKPDTRTEYLYFLERGLASTDALSKTGRSVEVGVTGREGVVGFHTLLGEPTVPHLVIMQGAGAGYRIRASALQPEFAKGGEFQKLFHRFLYSHLVQISQSVLCNRLHEAEPRLARWLLMASDHMETDYLVLTQEFISQMLGSTRSTVTITAGELMDQGLIHYSRGKIRILDRPGLEKIACECYAIVRAQQGTPELKLSKS
jgi:CRP-like cAMP-binding protein